MAHDELRATILGTLTEIAPNIDAEKLQDDINFRDQFDFDSLDFLRFVTALNERLQVSIDEADYPRLSSLNGCIDYLGETRPSTA